MSNIALKKILNHFLLEKYPKIKDIHVSHDEFGYSIGVSLKYDDLSKFNKQDIDNLKKEIRNYAKYVLGVNQRVNNIYFYDTN